MSDMNTTNVTVRDEIIGAVLTLLNVLALTVSSVGVQALAGYVPDFELNAIRLAGMGNIFIIFIGKRQGQHMRVLCPSNGYFIPASMV